MIIPSIDLMGGSTVQLVGGREKKLDAGPPHPIARKFSLAGEIAVIDLDAAIGTGSNRALIEPLLRDFRCRVGGGIRSVEAAISWLDAGAAKVILGTAATPALLGELRDRGVGRDRIIAAVDCFNGEVVVKGWREGTGRRVEAVLAELAPYVGGFLVTFVEREGQMTGLPAERAIALLPVVGEAKLTVAGGLRSVEEIAALDRIGVDAQVGMAIYTGAIDLADAIAAPLVSDRPDGLVPTVVCDEAGRALGLAYSSRESLRVAVNRGVGAYQSRTRGLWVKGETSGAVQELLAVGVDCDRDCLRFTVRQSGPGFCHHHTATCWGDWPALGGGGGLAELEATLAERRRSAPPGSYSRRLFDDADLLTSKLVEEARELSAELSSRSPGTAGVVAGVGAACAAGDVGKPGAERMKAEGDHPKSVPAHACAETQCIDSVPAHARAETKSTDALSAHACAETKGMHSVPAHACAETKSIDSESAAVHSGTKNSGAGGDAAPPSAGGRGGRVLEEASDLLYFTMVALAREGLTLADVGRELSRRGRKVSRRPGNKKPPTPQPPTSA